MKLLNKSKKLAGNPAKGFSLVEATIGLGTFSTVVLALYSAVISAFGGIQLARENLRASQILVEKMDAVRLLSWHQIEATGFVPSTFTEHFDPAGVQNGTGAGITYQGTVKWDSGPSGVSYSSDLKYVTVTLEWNSQNHGMKRVRSFQTLVTKNGLQSYIY